MAEHVLGLNHLWPRYRARTDDEEGRLQVLRFEEVEQARRVRRRPVIKRGAPVVLVRTVGDVAGARAASAGPPAVSVGASVFDSLSIRRVGASSEGSRVDVGNVLKVDLAQPLLDFGRVERRNTVERRVMGGVELIDCAARDQRSWLVSSWDGRTRRKRRSALDRRRRSRRESRWQRLSRLGRCSSTNLGP